jgi:iron(III) transport system permease protein
VFTRPGQTALFVGILALLVLFIGYPLATVLVTAVSSPSGFTLAHLVSFFERALFVEALVNTLLAGAAAVVLGSLVAVPLALVLARYDFPGRGIAETLAVLPLVVPPFVGAVAFQQVLGRSGVVNLFLLDTFGTTVPFMEGLTGVILVQALHYFPFILVNTAAALAGIDPAAEEAAQSLGCHGVRLLWRVTLPLALPGFGAGALLAFIRVIDDLGTPLMLNYTKMLAPQAYLRVTTIGMNDVDGYVICVILVALSLAALWAAKALLGRGEWASLARGPERRPKMLRGGRAVVAWAIVAVLLIPALVPHLGIVVLSFSRVWSFSYVPSVFTFANYGEILVRTPHLSGTRCATRCSRPPSTSCSVPPSRGCSCGAACRAAACSTCSRRCRSPCPAWCSRSATSASSTPGTCRGSGSR